MCSVNYTVTVFKISNTAVLPIVNFHFVIVTRPAVSLRPCVCLLDVFIPLIIHYFPTFVTWFGGEKDLKNSQNV